MYNSFDLIFFLGSLFAVIAVGFWTTRRQKSSVNDYFRGGNRLPWYAIGFSIIAAGISSEQFVGEIGYAYRWGMPVVNWEWLVFPSLTILLWVFVPLYIRNNITTMPEYLENRFGGRGRICTDRDAMGEHFSLCPRHLAPMAAPVVVVFLCGALWKGASPRGAIVCLWLSILSVPFTILKCVLNDCGIHFMPTTLENPMVLAGAVNLFAWTTMATLTERRSRSSGIAIMIAGALGIVALAAWSPTTMAVLVGATTLVGIILPATARTAVVRGLWDRSMLHTEPRSAWYVSVWLWWGIFAVILGGMYWFFW